MTWQGSDGVAKMAEKAGLDWINCPNGGGNVSAEFGRDITDFGDTPGTGQKHLNHTSPGLLGVQTNMWEQGWGWQTTKPFGATPRIAGQQDSNCLKALSMQSC